MDDFKKKFAQSLGEATEYTGKKMSYDEVADALNDAGIRTSVSASRKSPLRDRLK